MMLRLIDPPRYHPDGASRPGPNGTPRLMAYPYEVGDCWYATREGDAWLTFPDGPRVFPLCLAAPHDRPDIRPMIVVLPGGADIFCLHCPAGGRIEDGWTVTGDLPNVTVHPSINVVDIWHGWLIGGELRA